MSRQLPLDIQLREGISFSNYCVGGNAETVYAVQQCIKAEAEPYVFIWGNKGVGKTHLLQACCHELSEQGQSTAYIPLALADELDPQILQGLQASALVCIDDVQVIAKHEAWEEALFHFYNQAREAKTRLIISADVNPASLPIQLPDLQSRLSWGVVMPLIELTDEDKLSALMLRAQQRGFDFPVEVGRYLLTRIPRDMPALFSVLDQLDEASLAQQRKLTIPFVKQLLQTLSI